MMFTEWKKIRVLGEGSYGTVSLASTILPEGVQGVLIAVKSSKPHGVKSLQKEEAILELFYGCKEIVQCIWGLPTMENGRYIYNLLMEYAPLGSLGNLIKKRKSLLESEVQVYTRMLLKGLSIIHQYGVVHCDLKPDNVLLFPNHEHGGYQLKISDFGLSKTKDEVFDADSWKIKFRGTPYYMSPESVMGQIEAPLDIWSLGCMVIEMLTGLPAWHHVPTTRDLMFKLAFLKEAPPLPSNLSPLCGDFLNKCFVKDPNQRWTANMLLNHPFVSITGKVLPENEKFIEPKLVNKGHADLKLENSSPQTTRDMSSSFLDTLSSLLPLDLLSIL
ncbi:mitogen-activated protein kinase kinase kinase 17-like [Cajanus cajan]|uniref:mitogen-activated protein kinase kinase kinase 17-like n=1 Tax=Cajanus cajan TaxID=3821 RepID=UPI00098D81C6|nr:mitogen-activated protein kinase kinase kinase 17-like [Cajanus cajan]